MSSIDPHCWHVALTCSSRQPSCPKTHRSLNAKRSPSCTFSIIQTSESVIPRELVERAAAIRFSGKELYNFCTCVKTDVLHLDRLRRRRWEADGCVSQPALLSLVAHVQLVQVKQARGYVRAVCIATELICVHSPTTVSPAEFESDIMSSKYL